MLLSVRVLEALSLACFIATSNASILFSGGTVVAFDRVSESLEVFRNGSVLVTGDKIVAVRSTSELDIATLPPDTDVVDITGDIISTGFVDTHRHMWQTVFKTLGSNTSLAEYIYRYSPIAPGIGSIVTADDVYISQLAGLYESLNAGVTTVLDYVEHTWSNSTAEAGLRASIDSGARVFWCYGIFDSTNFTFAEHVANFRDIALNRSFHNTTVSLGIGYDGFNPGVPEQTRTVTALAKEFNVSAVTTHSFLGQFGFTNAPEDVQAADLLNTSIPVIFAHSSYITTPSAELLRQTNQYISITPESEMHYGHDHPSSHLLQDQASLGVDTHFTYSSDILTQARIWLQSARQTFYRMILQSWEVPVNNPMSVNQAFLLATRSGGLALRRDDIGVLAEGAKADLIVWNGKSPSLLGWDDPVAAIILHASVGDIKHVMVDGKFKKKSGQLTEKKYSAIQERFLESARRIQSIWKETPLPVLEGQSFSGFSYAHTQTADVVRGQGDGYGEQLL